MRTSAANNKTQASVLWLGGFQSDITGAKADALFQWAGEKNRNYRCFDYSGHGASQGPVSGFTLSRGIEDALAVHEDWKQDKTILVGSSMGAWIALRLTQILVARKQSEKLAGMVLIAPAPDFTERLMWDKFSEKIRNEILQKGVYHQPSDYSDEPYPITRELIDDGRKHLILDKPYECPCPVHIIHGLNDADVPWQQTMELVNVLQGCVSLSLIKGGGHRLSSPKNLQMILRAVEGIA